MFTLDDNLVESVSLTSPTDHSSDLTKPKDNKTWKGRVAKKFKRYGSSSAASSVDTGSSTEVTGTFGVPLEQCPPSNFFEVGGRVSGTDHLCWGQGINLSDIQLRKIK